MRAMVALLVLALALPVASAASATLTLTPPEGPVASGTTANLRVRLELREFWCQQPREVAVEAMVRGSGAEASLPNGSLRFMTDDQPHFSDVAVFEGDLPVAVRALGEGEGTVEIVASVAPPADCFAPDGFGPAGATATLRVAPAAPATPPPAEPAVNATASEGNETAEGNEGVENNPQESVGGDGRAPPGSGPIGDYRPPEGARDAPGVGVAALAALGAAVALAMGRGKR